MRLIDADALRAEFKTPTDWLDSKQVFIHVTGIWATIDHAPTIEPERKIGQPDNDRIWNALSKVYNMDAVPDEAKSIIGDVMLGLGEPHRKEGVRK